MEDKPGFPPNLAILVSIIAVSTASILIRLSDAPPVTIAAYRMVISTLILAPFYVKDGGLRRFREMDGRRRLSLLAVGVVLAVHFASWITSLSLTSVSSSVIFVHIDPIFVALVSHFILGERVTRKTALGIMVAFSGATLIALGDMGLGAGSLYGDALALLGGVMLGIYILGGRHLRQSLDLVSYVTPVYATAALVLLATALVLGVPLTGYASSEYAIFLTIAVVPMIFGHTVYNWALRYVSAPIVSLSLLGEPVGASVMAYMLLGEAPSQLGVIGGAVTLMGILISAYKPE
jgi:drug/metabolite transporter (DMT)-like permease